MKCEMCAVPLGRGVNQTDEEKRLGERIAREVDARFMEAREKRWAALDKHLATLTDFQKTLVRKETAIALAGALRNMVETFDDDDILEFSIGHSAIIRAKAILREYDNADGQ